MPTSVESPIDFRQLKFALAASDEENPVNCVVARFCDGSVRIAVDRRQPSRLLARSLEGPPPARYFYGTAYADDFPGTLCLTLDRTAPWMAGRLRVALRGSGYGKVEIMRADGELTVEELE
jgi:hypothetical protein